MKRREVIKNLSILPISGAIFGGSLPLGSMMASPAATKQDLFKELGLRTFINAAGTITKLSGSLMHDEVLEAINSSSKEFVLLDEVQDRVGEKIAAICHAEAATVTAGCWSAIILGTAGVLTRMDQGKVGQLPNVNDIKSEVILQKTHKFGGYYHAITHTGAKIVEIETADELEKAVNAKTAMLWFVNFAGSDGKISHEEFVALGKKLNIPTMIDIAADVPPVENLWKYNDMGFDLVCISGGKGLRGPQSTGILMGKKDLIAAARLSACPASGIGRGMKVNKEEILGLYVALKKYVNTDHEKEWKMWEDQISIIENAAKKVNGVITSVTVPPVANRTPHLNISWDINKVKVSSNQFQNKLQKGHPSIEVMGGKGNSILLSVFMLKPGQEKIVAKRVLEELTKASV